MVLLILFSFLAGLVTIFAPCIWPILPIVFSTSLTGKGKSRPFGISIGVVISFSLLTLFISYLVRIFHFDPNVLRTVAVLVIIILGLGLIIPSISAWLEILFTKLSNKFGQGTSNKQGFAGGLVTGLTLGTIWTPCAGPILATVAALTATNQINSTVILITVAYAVGIAVPLFLIAYGSQRFIDSAKKLGKFTPVVQKIFGVIMIATAIAIYTNYDQTLQLKLINKFPILGTVINGFENSKIVTEGLNSITGKNTATDNQTGLFNVNTPAPEFTGITKWLNTDHDLKMADLKGRVVLVDFWTYTCINCIRTLPFVTSWYDKYKDLGFTVIGVHTPEFEFEKDTNNVLSAIRKYNIHYPVAQDNSYSTWNTYSNSYWPAEYLIDAKGNIRRFHFGEGEYDKTELAIQTLLKEAGKSADLPMLNMPDLTPKAAISPETYLGSGRSEFNPNLNISGDWKSTTEYIESGSGSVVTYKFTASKVYIILKPGEKSGGKVKVLLDGNVINANVAGVDVKDGEVTVDSDRLYNIVDLGGKTENHTLRLEFENPGIQAFTFTFG